MLSNKVVVRFKNGAVLKGVTTDFNPEKPVFHVQVKIGEKVNLKEVKKAHFLAQLKTTNKIIAIGASTGGTT
ncbi:MAG: hypothetical protein N3B13_08830, partial [Deltaproteobacteria bacterium]|nr:hypothetical protein [Deltaproteobacteria bacterium]